MSNLLINLHPLVKKQLAEMALSPNANENALAAQLFQLIGLMESFPAIRDRLLTNFQPIDVKDEQGKSVKVNIKLIQALKDEAGDSKYFTDAIRRIRDLNNWPCEEYRLFFAPRKNVSGMFCYEVLGIFHKDIAYNKETLEELRRRYQK